MSGFDWPTLMQAGLQGLGLHPQEFWRLTPVELKTLLGAAPEATSRLGRARLDELLAAYPDACVPPLT